MRELRPGLWHWEAPHPEWRPTEPWSENVSSYAIDDGERLLLFDPLAVPSELGDLAAGRETASVLTAPRHARRLRPRPRDQREVAPPWCDARGDRRGAAPATRIAGRARACNARRADRPGRTRTRVVLLAGRGRVELDRGHVVPQLLELVVAARVRREDVADH